MTNQYACISQYLDINIIDSNINIFNKRTKISYVIGINEYTVLIHADGTNSIDELSKISGKFSVDQIRNLLTHFERMELINDVEVKSKNNIIKMKRGLFNGNKLIKSESIVTKLCYFILVYLSMPIFGIGLFCFFYYIKRFRITDQNNSLVIQIITSILLFLIIASIHELSHAIVARRFRVNVPEIGLMVYYFMPLVYTNLSFIRLLKSKSKRLLCLGAGIFSNFLLSGISFLIACASNGNISLFFERVAVLNLTLIVINLMVFFKLDGYFIFQELIEESFLREKSIAYVRSLVKGFVSKQISRKQKLSKVRYKMHSEDNENKVFYFIYGFMCITYIPVMLISAAWNLLDNIL